MPFEPSRKPDRKPPMKLYDLLAEIATEHLGEIRSDGSMNSGHNGLYHDTETPVRNTCHWLVTFSRLFDYCADERFENAAMETASYLQSRDARPHDASFHHRSVSGKDRCNGLIGQAWSIEGLAEAARVFDDADLAAVAEDVFLMHPQDTRTGLWKRVEIDGTILPYDATFNHQLWFAAAGGLLAELPWTSDRVNDRVECHLDSLEANVRLYPSGLIFHPLKPTWSLRRYAHLVRTDRKARIGITFLTSTLPLRRRRAHLRQKAIGYHSFNLYAFALLKRSYPDHEFWDTLAWEKAIKYATMSSYRERVWENEYGSPYNPVGFEIPFTFETFERCEERNPEWIASQFDRHYSDRTAKMDRNTSDATTLTARIYEGTRLSDVQLPLENRT